MKINKVFYFLVALFLSINAYSSSGTIKLKRSPFGYYLETEFVDINQLDCKKISNKEIKYLYFFTRSLKKRSKLRQICSDRSLGKSYFSSRLKAPENSQIADILKFYYGARSKDKLNIEHYSKVLKNIKNYKDSILKEILIIHWHFYFEKISNVKSKIENLASISPNERLKKLDHLIESQVLGDRSSVIRIKQIVEEVIRSAKARLGDYELMALVEYLKFFDWEEIDPSLDKKIKEESEYNKGKVSDVLKNYRWGIQFPNLWSDFLLNKKIKINLERYLLKSLRVSREIVPAKRFISYQSYFEEKSENSTFKKFLAENGKELNQSFSEHKNNKIIRIFQAIKNGVHKEVDLESF